MVPVREALPSRYYYFFWLVEPLAMKVPATILSFLNPSKPIRELLPEPVEPHTLSFGASLRGQMLIHHQAVFFIIGALNSLALYPLIRTQLAHDPVLQARFVGVLQRTQLIADAIMFGLNLWHIPNKVLAKPSSWTGMIKSTFIVMPILMSIRASWFLGIGRQVLEFKKD